MFKNYRKKELASLRPITQIEADSRPFAVTLKNVSISKEDLYNESPKLGDMIAQNPKNPKDQWLVSEEYFKDNFEEA